MGTSFPQDSPSQQMDPSQRDPRRHVARLHPGIRCKWFLQEPNRVQKRACRIFVVYEISKSRAVSGCKPPREATKSDIGPYAVPQRDCQALVDLDSES